MARLYLACALVFVLGGCSTREDAPGGAPLLAPLAAPLPEVAGAPAQPPDASTDQMVDHLALLATGRPLDKATRSKTIDALRSKSKTMDQYIEELVLDPDFARVVIPRVLFGEMNFRPMSFYAMRRLRSKDVDGQPVHFYRKACAITDTVEVAPWWDPKQPIRICVDDYKPDGFVAKDGNTCSSSMTMRAPECGCGRKLINCVRDEKHNVELLESLYRESIGTIAHVVEGDRPFKEVFTTSSSFRDRNTEYMRLRDKLYVGKIKDIPDLSSWPAEGKWAPREEFFPGAHAGILTNIQYLYMSDGPRDRMRLVFARTWCSTPASFGVTSDQFHDLVAQHASIRSSAEGWKDLAAAPGCSDCHARMDYGMQFFMAYPAIGKSFTPILADSRHAERGPIYVRDIEDPRGEAALTPKALGELIVAQPEFAACMVEHVQDHVLGSSATPAEHDALLKVFTETGKMQPLFTTALRLFATRTATATVPRRAVRAAARPSGTSPSTDQVAIPEPLASQLVEQCGDCHEAGDDAFLAGFVAKRTLPRELLLDAANLVSSNLMPKDSTLEAAEKAAMLNAIVDALAPDPTWAANARGYWLDEWWGSRTHHLSAVKAQVAIKTSYQLTPEDRMRSVEEVLEGDLMTLTPSYMAQLSQLALKACRALVADKVAYRACLRSETRADTFLIR